MHGVMTLDIFNIAMIIFTFITLSLKYGYDEEANDMITRASAFDQTLGLSHGFLDFSNLYLYYEFLAILDSVLCFFMSLSLLKYTFLWIPSLKLLTNVFQAFFNLTIKRLFCFTCLLTIIFALYFHYFYSYVVYGFSDLSFSLIRTNLLLIQGTLFNKNKFYLVEETIEYVYQRLGWGVAILNIGGIHLFGRYIIINIITAFMKSDI